MHIPPGFLKPEVWIPMSGLSVAAISYALKKSGEEIDDTRMPVMGVVASFIFAAQMVNFPVAGGTSGHLVGGVLVAALLGPSAAVVVLATVLIIQCFLFGDGGVLALGANLFNMGILGAAGGAAVYRLVCAVLPGAQGRVTAVAFAGWCSSVLAAIGCSGELAWSGTVGWSAGFAAMTGVHLLIGLGEGLISALVFLAILRTRPDLVTAAGEANGQAGWGELVRYGVLGALGLAVWVAPFACPWPDGLESVAARLGFAQKATEPMLPSLAPDYRVPGVEWAAGATAIAGAAGTLVVFGLALLLGRWLVRKPQNSGRGSFGQP